MGTFVETPDFIQAWQMILGQLKVEMLKADFETWVKSLTPLGFENSEQPIFRLGATNAYARDWVDARLKSTICTMLKGLYKKDVDLEIVVANGFYDQNSSQSDNLEIDSVTRSNLRVATERSRSVQTIDQEYTKPVRNSSPSTKRKMLLEAAYGSEKASIIQPERGILVTNYLMDEWTPIIKHSGVFVVLAARRLCYWNVGTGEKRNIVETNMSIIARKADVSLRTVKSLLKNEIIRKYFLRYKVRRVMTPNGIRTAGIILQVRMDDPLTPEDQNRIGHQTDDIWYSPGFEDIDDVDTEDEISAIEE
jgi:hypothetical protein